MNQVLGGQVGCSTIIDSHQIVFTASWIRLKAPIQQNNRDSRLVQRFHKFVVGLKPSGRELDGRKEYSRYPLRDVLMAQLLGYFFVLVLFRCGISPEQRMSNSLLSFHHAFANHFEDLGLTKLGDQQAKDVAL